MKMRTNTAGATVALLLLMGALSGTAQAQPTTDRSASIVVVPRVVVDGTRDTVIELANTGNSQVQAFCLFLDGTTVLQTNFTVDLAAQQPTRWVASQGRRCAGDDPLCLGGPTGVVGLIPPVPVPFDGAMLCIETDQSGAPVAGNHLVGGATIKDRSSGDVASYSGVGIPGFDTNDGDDVLCLGGEPSSACPGGAEFDGCPATWLLSHVAEGAEDELIGANSAVTTELTILTCGQDFLTATPTDVPLQFVITNEFETVFSLASAVSSWRSDLLGEIGNTFDASVLGTPYARTRVTSPDGGILLVARELHALTGVPATATSVAFNPAHQGIRANEDVIVLPPR